MTCEQCSREHDNSYCICKNDDWDRAAAFAEHIDSLDESPHVDAEELRLMPLDGEKKEPAIVDRTSLESEEARKMMMGVDEAYTALYNGHPGFAIYFGRVDHGTENLLAVDRDEPDKFPDEEMPETGLVVESGSGTDPGHYYYTHDEGDVQNSQPEAGEARTENLYCILAGAVHPSGGIYNVSQKGEPGHVTQEDIPEDLHPVNPTSTGSHETIELPPAEDVEDAEFTNSVGKSLEWARERDEKLDDVISRLEPSGYGHNDTSQFDFWACYHLFYWRFDKHTVARIMRRYRNRSKLRDRGDYLSRTVQNAREQQSEKYEPGTDPSGPRPMATLPLARLDALSHEERVRYANRRNIDWPDVDEVQGKLYDDIISAVEDGDRIVKSAPTGAGKTHAVATTPWLSMPDVTDDKPVIHAHRTRKARDQAAAMSEEAGVDYYVLKGRTELCPVAAGSHDPDNEAGNAAFTIDGQPISEWLDHLCDRQGLPFSVAHRWAEAATDRDLPCERGDTECAAKGQFDGIPRGDENNPTHDVIHCTHQFLHVPSLRMHTHIFIDEKPAFGVELSSTEIRESINAYLDHIDAPVSSYSELVYAAEHDNHPQHEGKESIRGLTPAEASASFTEAMDEALNGDNSYVECPECGGDGERHDEGARNEDVTAYPEHGGAATSNTCPECNGDGKVLAKRGTPPLSWYKDTPKAHTLAPSLTRAIWRAEESAGDRKHARVVHNPPRFDQDVHDNAAWNREIADMVCNDQWEVTEMQAMPDFSLAQSVIGLDAHPQPSDPFWRANVHTDLTTEYTLDQQQRTLYRRYERGLFTVQVGEGTQPVTRGKWLDEGQGAKFEAIIEHLRDHYGEDFDSAITSMSAKPFIREAMRDAGVDEPEMMHFGNEESRNDFSGKPTGLVAGSIDPGDNKVLDLCARLDLDVDACYKECPTCDGSGVDPDAEKEAVACPTCDGDTKVRERGRTFEGEDADHADAVLKGVTQHHVAQSAGRWARDATDPDDTATVYIVTDASPDGFIDARAPGVTWLTNEDQRERLEYVRDQPGGATAREVADACDCSKRAANRTLKKARENGLLEYTPGGGTNGAHLYWPGDAFTPNGVVETTPSDGAASAEAVAAETEQVREYNTCSIAVDALPHCALSDYGDEQGSWDNQAGLDWFAEVGPPPG